MRAICSQSIFCNEWWEWIAYRCSLKWAILCKRVKTEWANSQPWSLHPYLHPSLYLFVKLYFPPTYHQSVCPSIYLSPVHPFVCPSVCSSICLSFCFLVCASIRHSICISLFSGSSFHSLHIYIPLYNFSFAPPSAPPFALIIAHSSNRELRIAWYYNFMNIFFTVKNFLFFLYCILEITNFCNLKK